MKVKRRNLVIVVLIAVGFIVAGGVPGLMGIFDDLGDLDVEGKTYYSKGVCGGSLEGGAPNDLLDTESYVTSWAGAKSEKIVIRPFWMMYEGGPLVVEILDTWVVVKIIGKGDGVLINGVATTTWQSERVYTGDVIIFKDQWFPVTAIIVELTGSFTGHIEVELWCFHKWDVFLNSGDDMIASDKAYILPGLGTVDAQEVVEEGTSCAISIETGFATTAKEEGADIEGWTVSVYSLRTGDKVYSTIIGDDWDGVVKWDVPMGTFVSGDNGHRVVLRNELMGIDWDDFFVIGQVPGVTDPDIPLTDQLPKLPTFKVVEGDSYTAGSQITVEMYSEANDITGSPVAGFWVNVFYETVAGQATTHLVDHQWYAASNDKASIVITFPEPGLIVLSASAQDEAFLNSGDAEMRWTIYAAGDVGAPPPSDDKYDLTNIILVAVLVIAAIIVYWSCLLYTSPSPRDRS